MCAWGLLFDLGQRKEVLDRISELSEECEVVLDGTQAFDVVGGDYEKRCFPKADCSFLRQATRGHKSS